jgi:hypothetical protein
MWRRGISPDNGVALVIVLMAIILLVALGLMLVLNTLTEVMVAGHYRLAQEAFYAADAVAERGMDELAGNFDWNSVLIGAQQSGFVDGQGPGARTLSDGSTIDLTNATNLLNCGHAAACTPAEMDAQTADRPWGSDNPRWILYAYGPLAGMVSGSTVNSNMYVGLWVADDPSEIDHDPLSDSNDAVALHAEAFGPGEVHRIVEVNIGRVESLHPESGIRLIAWREVR